MMDYHRQNDVDVRIARIFNTYGPRMRLNDGRVVPNFIYQALSGLPLTVYGDGSQSRSFQYYTDLVEGVCRLLDSDLTAPVNIGNPDEMIISDFAEAVVELTGSQSEIVYVQPTDDRVTDDPKMRRPDISQARELLGWEPKVKLADGLVKTIEFFRSRVS